MRKLTTTDSHLHGNDAHLEWMINQDLGQQLEQLGWQNRQSRPGQQP